MTFLDLLARSRVAFQKRTGFEVSLNCPFCSDTEFRFNINTKTGAGKCWHASCDYRSKRADLAVLRQLRLNAEGLEGGIEEEIAPEEPVELPRDFHRLTTVLDSFDRRALRYLLQDRRITREQIRERRIGISLSGVYHHRVVMPNYIGGILRGIVARDFTGRLKPKYLNSKGTKHLYGFDPAAKKVVLAEGIFKSLRLERAGFSAAALLGHDLTDVQLKQIQNSKAKEIIIWPDLERVGRTGAAKVADLLTENWDGKVSVAWPVFRPADDASLPELRETKINPWGLFIRESILAGK